MVFESAIDRFISTRIGFYWTDSLRDFQRPLIYTFNVTIESNTRWCLKIIDFINLPTIWDNGINTFYNYTYVYCVGVQNEEVYVGM